MSYTPGFLWWRGSRGVSPVGTPRYADGRHALKAIGSEANETVAIMAERSEKMVVGLLGILKAGAAYLPVDPSYPDDRKAYMLSDSGNILFLMSVPHASHALSVFRSGSFGISVIAGQVSGA